MEFLKDFGFSNYELKALETLLTLRQAAASIIAKQGDIPTSKVYAALDKLVEAGLVIVQEDAEGTNQYAVIPTPDMVHKVRLLQKQRQDVFDSDLRNWHMLLQAQENPMVTAYHEVEWGKNAIWTKHFARVLEAQGALFSVLDVYRKPDFGQLEKYLVQTRSQLSPTVKHQVLICTDTLDSLPGSLIKPMLSSTEFRTVDAPYLSQLHLWDDQHLLVPISHEFTGIVGSAYVRDNVAYQMALEQLTQRWFTAAPLLRWN